MKMRNNKQNKIFFSFSEKDKNVVNKLFNEIKIKFNIISEEQYFKFDEPGKVNENYLDDINKNLKESSHFIFFNSKNYCESPMCNYEYVRALELQKENNLIIFEINLDNIDFLKPFNEFYKSLNYDNGNNLNWLNSLYVLYSDKELEGQMLGLGKTFICKEEKCEFKIENEQQIQNEIKNIIKKTKKINIKGGCYFAHIIYFDLNFLNLYKKITKNSINVEINFLGNEENIIDCQEWSFWQKNEIECFTENLSHSFSIENNYNENNYFEKIKINYTQLAQFWNNNKKTFLTLILLINENPEIMEEWSKNNFLSLNDQTS